MIGILSIAFFMLIVVIGCFGFYVSAIHTDTKASDRCDSVNNNEQHNIILFNELANAVHDRALAETKEDLVEKILHIKRSDENIINLSERIKEKSA
jgi:hypothetical protein